MTPPPQVSVLFVCLGNICRSPAAEGLFLDAVKKEGLEQSIVVDSAGTAGYHIGERPDRRMIAAARARGVVLPSRARQVQPADLERFDYVIAMDRSNLAGLRRIASAPRARLELLSHWLDAAAWPAEVPDPYDGGPADFEFVLDMVTAAVPGLLAEVRERLAAG